MTSSVTSFAKWSKSVALAWNTNSLFTIETVPFAELTLSKVKTALSSKSVSFAKTSTVTLKFSKTEPVSTFAIGASFVPVIVMVTVLGVPSIEVTSYISVTVSPTFKASKALLARKVQAPLEAIAKVPIVPIVSLTVNKLSGLSGSVEVNVPAEVNATFVSSSSIESVLTVAGIFSSVIVSKSFAPEGVISFPLRELRIGPSNLLISGSSGLIGSLAIISVVAPSDKTAPPAALASNSSTLAIENKTSSVSSPILKTSKTGVSPSFDNNNSNNDFKIKFTSFPSEVLNVICTSLLFSNNLIFSLNNVAPSARKSSTLLVILINKLFSPFSVVKSSDFPSTRIEIPEYMRYSLLMIINNTSTE